ncbi:hypothetical protein ABT340_39420 [Streptosporangium sp. NPDC000239]|uniref:hypothetical protein n=1 Tax=Streptosporangium sp. NPDC000239 TaxID=3154248 RepID=UPI0033212E80
MGSAPEATLAYGYALGGADGWDLVEVDEYDGIDPAKVTWYDEDSEDDFMGQAEKRLLATLLGFTETDWRVDGYFAREREAKSSLGVKFYGHGYDAGQMYALVTKTITVKWGESKVLDLPTLMAEPAERGWDDKLAAALTALGITPKQERPGWLLCAYYG